MHTTVITVDRVTTGVVGGLLGEVSRCSPEGMAAPGRRRLRAVTRMDAVVRW